MKRNKTKIKEKVMEEKKLKIKLLNNIVASVIFIACRNAEEPKTMQEISSQLELDKKGVNRCYSLIKDTIEENKNQIPQTVSDSSRMFRHRLRPHGAFRQDYETQ